jgi:hypothetical protein
MARKPSKSKRKALGIRIFPRLGLWIKYQLALRGLTIKEFGEQNGVKTASASQVIRGVRKSARLEEAVYRILGYPSFEAMIIAFHNKGGIV